MTYEELLDTLRVAYDRGAATREAMVRAPWRLAERAAFADRLKADGARRLLEVGAGPGHDSSYFVDAGLDVVATDLSPTMVEYCRRKGLDARVMDVLGLDVPAGSFDAVYTVNCLVHVPNPELPSALASLADALRPGGLCFIGLWGGRSYQGTLPDDDHEPKRFFAFRTDDEIQRYASRHFDIVDFHAVEPEAERHFQSLTLRKST